MPDTKINTANATISKATEWKNSLSLDNHWIPENQYWDVIKKCAWTPKRPPTDMEVPKIICKEYQIISSHLMNQVNFYQDSISLDSFKTLANTAFQAGRALTADNDVERRDAIDTAIAVADNDDPLAAFAGLYIAEGKFGATPEPIATYIFPYYNSYHHQIQNSWQPHTGILGGLAEGVANLARIGLPSGGILTIQQWTGTEPANIPIEFILLNTVGEDMIPIHRGLIDRLVLANLSSRLNKVASLPPCIYSVEIPGIRWMPACYISNLQIINEGQMHSYGSGKKKVNVPEAYRIMLNFNELIPEQRQTYVGAINPNFKVEVIDPGPE